MQSQQGINLHDSKVVAEQEPDRDVDDVSWPFDEMRHELGRASKEQPDQIRAEDVASGEMIGVRVVSVMPALETEVDDETGAEK